MITRVIPRLDVKGPNLVKGVHLEGLRVLGKPELFARHYYEQGADELLFVDVVASLYGRNSILDLVERTANEIFIPLSVGGGLRSLDDIRAVLRAGADKVTLNTAAVRRPEFISEAARHFGSSTIVISIEAIRRNDGGYEAYTDNGREKTGLDAVSWAVRAVELGAGELLVTSIDREGTGRGYDLELTARIVRAVPVPVIACGGAGSVEHVAQVLETGAAAAALASLLHYNVARRSRAERSEFSPHINLAHLDQPGFAKVQDAELPELKAHLAARGMASRPLPAHV
ncbi:MAG: imidazole glycerol phosphate synthase subunit HisF [Gemmatimonadales bacterium]|nr:imidazole glycerol phosphate synthase subunit HisF [Gemmatimonadales bacterium]